MNEIEERKNRLKTLIRFAVGQGLASTQKDLGKILGYTNESSFSQIINGKVEIPKNFISKLKNLIPNLNEQWLLTGEGEMLNASKPLSSDSNTPSVSSLIDIIRSQQETIRSLSETVRQLAKDK